jgi:hypothetical protein
VAQLTNIRISDRSRQPTLKEVTDYRTLVFQHWTGGNERG